MTPKKPQLAPTSYAGAKLAFEIPSSYEVAAVQPWLDREIPHATVDALLALFPGRASFEPEDVCTPHLLIVDVQEFPTVELVRSMQAKINATLCNAAYGTKHLRWDDPKWWPCRCPQCGWAGMSSETAGGRQIADSGDYDDIVCPACVAPLGNPEAGQWVAVEEIPELVSPDPPPTHEHLTSTTPHAELETHS